MNPVAPLAVGAGGRLILRAVSACNEGGLRQARNRVRPVSMALATSLLTLLSACASTPPGEEPESKHGVVISGLVIRNELPYPVTDVMIEAPATGGFAGCGTVLPRTECRNTFQHVDYRGNAVLVRWKEHGQPYQTDEFTIHPPPATHPGDEFRIEVIVFAPGQAGARLVEAVPAEVRNR